MNLNYILRRRALLLQSNKLPRGYVPLDYIESSGVQYIDTGIPANDKLTFRVYAQLLKTQPGNGTVLCGRQSSSIGSMQCNQLLFIGQTGVQFVCGNTNSYTGSIYSNGELLNMNCFHSDNKNNLYLNDEIIIQNSPTAKITQKNNVWLFTGNTGGVPQFPGWLRMAGCILYIDGRRVRDFIPCLNPDGIAGMYDLVEGKFYDSATAHKFIAGNRIVELPEGYQQVEYIENTNYAYINTGIGPDSTSKTIMRYYAPAKQSSQIIFGSRLTNISQTYTLFRLGSAGTGPISNNYRWDFSNRQLGSQNSTDGIVTIKFEYPQSMVDDTIIKLYETTTPMHSDLPIYIFAGNTNNTVQYPFQGKLYSYKYWMGDKLERDYIPCINPSGEVGLYDLVEKKFYGSADPNYKFVAGDIVNVKKVKLPVGYKQLDYIDNNSNAYIDLLRKPTNKMSVNICGEVYPPYTGNSIIASYTGGSGRFQVFVYENHLSYGFGSKWTEVPYNRQQGIHTYKLGLDGFIVDGVNMGATEQTPFTSQFNNYLFAMNLNNTPQFTSKGKMYYCKLYDDNRLIQHLIPCINPDNVVGMYDLIEGKFYSSPNGAKFLPGNVINSRI